MLTFIICAVVCCVYPPALGGVIGFACLGVFGGIVGLVLGHFVYWGVLLWLAS
jgi:integral membrane sensor domain MASE1